MTWKNELGHPHRDAWWRRLPGPSGIWWAPMEHFGIQSCGNLLCSELQDSVEQLLFILMNSWWLVECLLRSVVILRIITEVVWFPSRDRLFCNLLANFTSQFISSLLLLNHIWSRTLLLLALVLLYGVLATLRGCRKGAGETRTTSFVYSFQLMTHCTGTL